MNITKKGPLMLEINYLAVLAAAIAAFVLSSVWYIALGSSEMPDPPAWKKVAEVVRSFVVACVIARFVVLLDVTGWMEATAFAIWVWIGFPAAILAGSVLWENTPVKAAAVHVGDWLLKLILMAVVLAMWR